MPLADNAFTFIYQTSLVLVLSLLFYFGLKWLSTRWQKDTSAPTRGVVISAIRTPLLVMPWMFFLLFTAHFLPHYDASDWHDSLLVVEKLLVIIYPAWAIWLISLEIKPLLESMGRGWSRKVSDSVVARTLQLVVVIITLLSIAQVLGYSLSALMAFGGIGGIIIGLAAREWLANFFGGLMLMLDRPFAEGDWIRSPDRNIEGHVEQIGWRLTRIRTFERRPIYVPNSLFNGIVVENATRMRNRRMVENFALRYEDVNRLSIVLNRIIEIVEANPDIDCHEPHYARFIKYDESSLLCQVRVHIKKIDRLGFLEVQQSVLLAIARAVEEQGAEFAYPVRRLINDDPGLKPL